MPTSRRGQPARIFAGIPLRLEPHSARKGRAADIPSLTDHSGREKTGKPASPAPRILSEAQFAELYRASSKALWCIALAVLRDRTAAQDVVQDAAMIALSKRAEFDEGSNFTAWAGQIVRFTALNELRKRQRDRAVLADSAIAGMAGSGTRPSRLPTPGLDPKLSSALDTLDETARACLLLRTVMNQGYREIASALGIPEGTAMSHVHRSRQTLRSLLAGTHLAPPEKEGS